MTLCICMPPTYRLTTHFMYGAWWTCPACSLVWRSWAEFPSGRRFWLPQPAEL